MTRPQRDYLGITHTGRVIGKAEIMKAVAHNDETATEESEEQVKALGETAVYTAVITDHGTRPSTHAPYTIRTRIMQVWHLRAGEWQVVAGQETEVRDSALGLWRSAVLRAGLRQ
jgi:hypothetical protein